MHTKTTPRINGILVWFWRLQGIWWRNFSWQTVPRVVGLCLWNYRS